ncbi:MAG: Hsp20/alpha crystallin family protein [Ardenticatenaceae bacterium]|nr:Hsp20/alpha crystallin family protein [Ardenticatenaceae bacterium]
MNRLLRWNPTREMMTFRNEFDRLFENFLDLPQLQENRGLDWGLALDVAENDQAYTIKASVPGVNPDDIDITLSDNVLTIKGEFKEEKNVEEEKYHLRERRFGSFGRSLTLPVAVNAEAVEANYDNGVLTLTVPKAEEVKPKRITIKANQPVLEG